MKKWKSLARKTLVLTLSAAIASNTVDLSVLAAALQEDGTQEVYGEESTNVTITGFASLSDEVREQALPVGAAESEIVFPDTLTVTVEKGNLSVIREECTLEGITWKLDENESDAPVFDGSADGFCYVYTPVLPEKDSEGNLLVQGAGVELPTIYVLVGEYGTELLDNADQQFQVTAADEATTCVILQNPMIPAGGESVPEGYTSAPQLLVAAKKNDGVEGELSFQWRVKKLTEGEMPETDEEIEGATGETFQIPTGLAVGSYQYYCRVTCNGSSVDSSTVTFTVMEGLLQVNIDGKTTYYADLKEAFAAVDTAAQQAAGTLDVTLTLLKNVANGEAVQWMLTSAGQQVNLTIDLNGHELGCYVDGEWKSERADFSLGASGEKTKLTLMDSSSGGAGILHGALVATNGAELSVTKDYTAKTEALTVYWDQDCVTDFTRSLEERKNNGEAIFLYYRIWLPENGKISATEISGLNQDAIDNGNLKCFNELLYARAGSEIAVNNDLCAYSSTDADGQSAETVLDANKFTMPAAGVKLIAHDADEYGCCTHCGKTDLAIAYKNKHLTIEGLEGRTYDSWPQMLTGIMLEGSDGKKTSLTVPDYRYQEQSGKWLMFSCGTPKNSDADFETRYANNTDAYLYREGDAGFDASKAPAVTITGRGRYTGEFTAYFTIGKGTLQMNGPEECGNQSVCVYNGKGQKAWNNSLTKFRSDPSDEKQWTQCSYVPMVEPEYVSQVTTPDVMQTFVSGSVKICPNTVEYSTDDKKTWILERDEGSSGENMYFVTDAGEYPFYIRMTNKNCENEFVTEKLIAKITPKALTESMLVSGITTGPAYYMGKGTECHDYDRDVFKDSGILVDGNPYTLQKDKDYTISYENNVDVTTGGNKAKMRIVGTGNYGADAEPIEREFDIRYAFTPAQTTVSKDRWYVKDVPVVFNGTDSTTDADQILYSSATDGSLSGNMAVYGELSDAVSGTGEEYVFTDEGVNTRTLYVKDTETGYIGAPVEVTVQIDKTAPDWNPDGCGVQIKDNWSKKLLQIVSFGLFYNHGTLDIKLKADDAVSGIAAYYYYIQTVNPAQPGMAALTAEELDKLTFSEVKPGVNGTATIQGAIPKDNADGGYVVYAYAVDNAGNRSSYICSDGVVIDTHEPDMTIESDAVTTTDKTATCKVKSVSEDVTVCYFVIETSEKELLQAVEGLQSSTLYPVSDNNIFADYDTATGKWIPRTEYSLSYNGADGNAKQASIKVHTVSMQKGNTDNQFVLSGLKANTGYRLYASSIDLAGNLQTASLYADFTTQPTIPEVTVKPTLSGTYGTQAKDFKIKGGTVINPDDPGSGVLNGTWSFADTASAGGEYPTPGTDKEYVLCFTPEAGSACGTVEVKVVPQVAKKELKININAELEKTYGEPNPEISYGNTDWVTELVSGDTEEEVKAGLSMVTQATDTSPAGEYRFEVKSDSTKYDVKMQYIRADASVSQYGKLTVKKADAELTAAVNKYDKHFGDDAFKLDVMASHTETAVRYEVTEGADVVSVAADGTVTIRKAGNAKIRASLSESADYNAAADQEITVTVAKGNAPIIADQSRSYYYSRDNQGSIDVNKLLPSDYGKITDEAIVICPRVKECVVNHETGMLTYKVLANEIGETETFEVTVTTENYEPILVTVHINWTDKQEVFVKAGTEVTLKNSIMTYGDRLSALEFKQAEFVDMNGNPVTGTLAWEDETAIPAAGTAGANWKFTPDDEAYFAKTDSVGITVNQATPRVNVLPEVENADLVYDPSQTLADLRLSDGTLEWTVDGECKPVYGAWEWSGSAEVPTAGIKSYMVVFRPFDKNYKSFSKMIAITLAKAKPYIETAPTAMEITYGAALDASALTGGKAVYGDGRGNTTALPGGSTVVEGSFIWKQPNIKPTVADSGNTEYTVEFIPADTVNYETVEFKVTLTVNKVLNPPDMPGDTMNVSYDCKTVGDVTLPDNWTWQNSDRSTVLEVGKEVTATAVYVGKDKDNYENVGISVKITRSTCKHGQTEKRNVKAATCTEKGYTGDTYCKDCGVITVRGTETAANGHDYHSQVTKEATKQEEGVKTYTCSRCGHSYTEVIPRLLDDSPQNDVKPGDNRQSQSGDFSGNGGSSGESLVQPVLQKPTEPAGTPLSLIAMNEEPTSSGQLGILPKTEKTVSGKQPFIKNGHGKDGWEAIREEIQNSVEGSTIIVDMNGGTKVPGEVLLNMRGKDITLVLDFGNGITWSVNGRNIEAKEMEDIDFGVTLGDQAGRNIPVEIINSTTEGKDSINLSLAYDGEFGFRATLAINLGATNAGNYANLFYYNEATGELEFMCAGEINGDGNVELEFVHASDYTIVIAAEPMNSGEGITEDTGSGAAEQETAGSSDVREKEDGQSETKSDHAKSFGMIIAAFLIAAGLAAFIVSGKRKENKREKK